VGGTVAGLAGSGLVLQNNAGDDIGVSGSGLFLFPTKLLDGAVYAVTVSVQPTGPAQNCVVTNGTGRITGADVSVTITCSTNTYAVGGAVTGLLGTGLVLQNNGGDDRTIAADGQFTFSTQIPDEAGYLVTVASQPLSPPQICTVTAGSGVLSGGPFGGVQVDCQSYLLAFITSVYGDGILGAWADHGSATGAAAGDAICQARAAAASLPGTYVAWLSDENNDAYCRLHGLGGTKAANCGQGSLPVAAGPWVRPDGVPFCPTIDQCLAPNSIVYAPPAVNEYGVLEGMQIYFTDTATSGISASYGACSDWTSNGGSPVLIGSTDSVKWTGSVLGAYCSNTDARLLCLATGQGPALTLPARAGKKLMFVTSTSGSGNLRTWGSDAGGQIGIAAGDAICQARALSASLPNASAFKAWLSSDAANAADRLTSDGPWVRVDGMPFANNKADLVDGTVASAPGLTELGQYLQSGDAWTGTGADGLMNADTCGNWLLDTASVATAGWLYVTSSSWTDRFITQSCNVAKPIYCFEDEM